MALLVKIVDINQQGYSDVSQSQATKTLTVSTKRGEIYDRNRLPLVNNETYLVSAVTPVLAVSEFLSDFLSKDELAEKIEKGYPFLCTVKEEINNEYIRTFSVCKRYGENQSAVHLIGYLDSSEQGVTGIEKAYNEYLTQNGGSIKVSFEVDAIGRVLAGMKKTVTVDNYYSSSGIVLTLDKYIQEITENALHGSSIERGTAIVMKAGTGEILALASVPNFNPEDVAQYLTDENSPLVNKAFQSYSLGSVFKPVIAAYALEKGITRDFSYECTGNITVGDTTFKCIDENPHGTLDMAGALENSCNTYFINLVLSIDTDTLVSFCKSLGFGESDELYSGAKTSSGTLPTESSLKLKGNLANFSFGQGELTATPLQLLSVYNILATGYKNEPCLIKGFTDGAGAFIKENQSEEEKILSDSTVKELRAMLSGVVESGIASKAKSETLSLSGKTGTAQSGVYENGSEIYRTWFAGYYPSENPEYIVVVMNENGRGGNIDCAPVFREICEKTAEIYGR